MEERREGAAEVGAIKASFFESFQTKQQNKRKKKIIEEEIPCESEMKGKKCRESLISYSSSSFFMRGKKRNRVNRQNLVILSVGVRRINES